MSAEDSLDPALQKPEHQNRAHCNPGTYERSRVPMIETSGHLDSSPHVSQESPQRSYEPSSSFTFTAASPLNPSTLSEGVIGPAHLSYASGQHLDSTTASETSSIISRSGRRAKAHTSNACNNCKRAHLGCNAERPCKRCMLSGKEDSCIDVPQKRRGRPRLKAENSSAAATPRDGVPITTESSRDLAYMLSPSMHNQRARPNFSFTSRSREFAPESGTISTLPTTLPAPPRHSETPVMPGRLFGSSGLDSNTIVPCAWLDLDLHYIKVDRHFIQIHGDHERSGIPLRDEVTTIQPNALSELRTRLRDEREAKDPAYLPPIINPGQDSLGPMEGVNMDQVTQGFDVMHYRLSFTLPNGQQQTLSTQFQLARTSRYFVVMRLPPLSREFFQVVVTQANQRSGAQQGNVGPTRTGTASMLSMFSDPRVKTALGSNASSPSDSPIDDAEDYDFPATSSSTIEASYVDSVRPEESRDLAFFGGPIPRIREPRPPDMNRERISRISLPSEESSFQRMTTSMSTDRSPVRSGISPNLPSMTQAFPRGLHPPMELHARSFSEVVPRRPPLTDIPKEIRYSQGEIPGAPIASTTPTRKAAEQGSRREEDKRRRMDIQSMLHG